MFDQFPTDESAGDANDPRKQQAANRKHKWISDAYPITEERLEREDGRNAENVDAVAVFSEPSENPAREEPSHNAALKTAAYQEGAENSHGGVSDGHRGIGLVG